MLAENMIEGALRSGTLWGFDVYELPERRVAWESV